MGRMAAVGTEKSSFLGCAATIPERKRSMPPCQISALREFLRSVSAAAESSDIELESRIDTSLANLFHGAHQCLVSRCLLVNGRELIS